MSRLYSKLLLSALLVGLAGCHPYGDSASDLGITASNVSNSGIARQWISKSGDILIIGSDSTISEVNCSTLGNVISVSQDRNCAGGTNCGSLSFAISKSSNASPCLPPDQYICSFITPSLDNTPTLSCSNSSMSFQYKGI